MKYNTLLKTITCSILLFSSICAYPQYPIGVELPRITPVSPEAAAVGKYVDYPVDMVTGLLPIEIPLFEIKEEDVTLPITLSYHASGLKVKEYSGWVGNGWTLNAEPSVSRTVNGIKDEENSSNKKGFFHHNYSNLFEYYPKYAKGELDKESDTYYFKLASSSGKFCFIRRSGNFQPLILPFGKERIHFTTSLSYFVILDENGIAYEFDGAQERTGKSANEIVTRWLGTRIKSSFTSAEILFEYQDDPYKQLSWTFTDKVTITQSIDRSPSTSVLTEYTGDRIYKNLLSSNGTKTPEYGTGDWGKMPTDGFTDGTLYCVKPRKITFSQGTMEFIMDEDRLDWIQIKDKGGNMVKKICFFVTKYHDKTEHTKLDSLHVHDARGKVVERYRFSYRDPNRVPRMSSRSVDHWGYYNGINNDNLPMVPEGYVRGPYGPSGAEIRISIGGAYRASNSNMQTGILTSIDWPGGRSTRFTYEVNNYFERFDTEIKPIMVGGLRIRRIEERDMTSSVTLIRNIDYMDTLKYNGRIKIVPDLSAYASCIEYWNRYTSGTTTKYRVYTWSSAALANLVYSNGSPVMYGTVTETRHGGGYDGIRKTVYTYHVRSYPVTKDNCAPFYFDDEQDWEYGRLKRVEEYFMEPYQDYVLTSTKVIKDTAEIFSPIIKDKIYFNTILEPYDKFTSDAERQAAFSYVYETFSRGKMLPKEEIYTEYFPDGSQMQTRKSYRYANRTANQQIHLNPVRITTTSSTGEIEEEFFYPEDMANIYLGDFGQGTLISSNSYNNLLAYNRRENGVTKSIRRTYSGGLPSMITTNTGANGSFENRIHYRYNRYGKPACVSHEGGPQIVYLWGYNSQYPIAAIENAPYEDVLQLLGGFNAVNDMAKEIVPSTGYLSAINHLRTALPQAMITTYTYQYLRGVTSQTDPSGRTIYYEYDNAGRLKHVKDDSGIINTHLYKLLGY